ncbi:MAG: DUF433 domain-containing protein [Thermomicrobiales bacterium]|nr:DUF433 domain-containing protein [Thermomicrobiales bacterium]
MSHTHETERIEVNPEIMLGKPVFRGTRIPVYVVLDLLSAGASPSEIVDDYPSLSLEDVDAAVVYRDLVGANVIERAL